MDGELLVDCFEQELEVDDFFGFDDFFGVDDFFGFEVGRVQRNAQHVQDEVLAWRAVRIDGESRGDFVEHDALHFDLHFALVLPHQQRQVRHVDVVDLRRVLGGVRADVGHIDRLLRVDVQEVLAELGAEGVHLESRLRTM